MTKCELPPLGLSEKHDICSQMWKRYMTSVGVSARDQQEADKLSLAVIRAADISKKFEAFNMDQRGAKAVSIEYFRLLPF